MKKDKEEIYKEFINNPFLKTIILTVVFIILFLIDKIIRQVAIFGVPYIERGMLCIFFGLVIFINYKYIIKNRHIKGILINILLQIIFIFIIAVLFNSSIFYLIDYYAIDLEIDTDYEYLIDLGEVNVNSLSDDGYHITYYYKIDLNKNVVIKCSDIHEGSYSNYTLCEIGYRKKLSDEESSRLEELFDMIFSNINTGLLEKEDTEEEEGDNIDIDAITVNTIGNSINLSNNQYTNIIVSNEEIVEEIKNIVEE